MADDLKPRLCHVRKWADFAGYGFNLHAEKGRVGQFIGKVDAGSPADSAGLKEGDRIVEVNGTNISNENHAQVVSRIKAVADETKLLVVDRETDDHYKEQSLVIRGDLPEVRTIICPKTMGGEAEEIEVSSSPTKDEPTTTVSAEEEEHPYKPRLCQLKIWPTFAGYGFNLHAEKNKPGQYIGKVDDGSPADAAGLREGDKIVEVNGENISTSNHQAVVGKIKENSNEAQLLVMDAETLAYFDRKNITVTSTSKCVQVISCPDQAADSNGVSSVVEVSAPPPQYTPITHPYNARLCHIHTWPDWQGFGFNMHSQKGKPGQFIGSVDAGSPADLAGLKSGDRILAVNGASTKGMEHPQVVQLIKTDTSASRLLLVDEEADEYFTSKDIEVKPTDDFVVFKESPTSKPLANGNTAAEEVEEVNSRPVNGDISAEQSTKDDDVLYDDVASVEKPEEEKQEEAVVVAAAASSSEPSSPPEPEQKDADEAIDAIAAVAAEAEEQLVKEEAAAAAEKAKEPEAAPVSVPAPVVTPTPAAVEPKSPVVIEGIEFACSAKEARERMARKKNVKDHPLSMKERYEMFQRL